MAWVVRLALAIVLLGYAAFCAVFVTALEQAGARIEAAQAELAAIGAGAALGLCRAKTEYQRGVHTAPD